MSAPERVRWALANLPGEHVLSSSFGIQAALMLHLVSRERADVPVVLTDTGYLFPETYRFIDELTERLALNLKIYRAELSPAWQEARFGLLWEQGVEDHPLQPAQQGGAHGPRPERAGCPHLVLGPAP